MTYDVWWLALLSMFIVSGIPGPNMLHVMTCSIRFGVRRSTAAMLGCALSIVSLLAVSAAGLGAVLNTSPQAFDVIRYIGVLYLIFLGVKAWRGKNAPFPLSDVTKIELCSPWQMFRGGLWVSLNNPKLILFATAFFPQFVNPFSSKLPQFIILIVTFVVCEFSWYLVYGVGGKKLASFITRPIAQRAFNRLIGSIFILFGLLLLRTTPI